MAVCTIVFAPRMSEIHLSAEDLDVPERTRVACALKVHLFLARRINEWQGLPRKPTPSRRRFNPSAIYLFKDILHGGSDTVMELLRFSATIHAQKDDACRLLVEGVLEM